MRFLLSYFLFIASALSLSAQSDQARIVYQGDESCAATKALILYQFNGVNMDKVAFLDKGAGNLFEYKMPKSSPQFYYVGSGASNAKPVILGQEDQVILSGNCKSFRAASTKISDLNNAYSTLRNDMNTLNRETNNLMRQMQAAKGDATQAETVSTALKALDDRKLDLLLQTAEENPYLGKIVALTTYLSFQNNGSKYSNELEYYANEFFQHVDWTDGAYQHNAWVYESVKSYTETISAFNFPVEVHKKYLTDLLNEIPSESHSHQLALAAIVGALGGKQHPNVAHFGQLFVDKYKNTAPAAAKSIKAQIAGAQAFMIGAEAPDFTQQTPEGEDLTLSELRGKVVLVDFWASWCGPCRRENPNVVKVYDKYKEQGFEILGVSLDKQKSRWLQAIEADKLTWKQVSDLKGWQNDVAKLYGVRSIPSTILLDTEGKIIARNLRGAALEAKLAEVFAEN
ncbi:MAG: TlpA disulfide reductase family protein [Bacteroidota bacterium]